ncbi:MAG: hypothetical protein FWH08_04565 [Oscillospiraceae bacterium]|nr:hypothetical protein [Oscillospiraceae bacterium]
MNRTITIEQGIETIEISSPNLSLCEYRADVTINTQTENNHIIKEVFETLEVSPPNLSLREYTADVEINTQMENNCVFRENLSTWKYQVLTYYCKDLSL